ncbi:MAG: fumarylacetoacetate hydrolase family protein [Bacteroidota bacterium]
MKIYNTSDYIIVEHQNQCYIPDNQDWDSFINHQNLFQKIVAELPHYELIGDSTILNSMHILAPIASQEIWASGVTYMRSKDARMEESKESGGATFYDKVYDADRPELFFKSTANRTVGPGQKVRIRKDSTWDVPEPELTLFVNSEGAIEGYTIGNDMSSRSIEGENPLYLPQAKMYDGAAALGPCILVAEEPIHPETLISIQISRDDTAVFSGTIAINQMKRKHTELVEYLFREQSFTKGVFLMTGTGIVPGNDFTLQSGDEVSITIEGIGTLTNEVE